MAMDNSLSDDWDGQHGYGQHLDELKRIQPKDRTRTAWWFHSETSNVYLISFAPRWQINKISIKKNHGLLLQQVYSSRCKSPPIIGLQPCLNGDNQLPSWWQLAAGCLKVDFITTSRRDQTVWNLTVRIRGIIPCWNETFVDCSWPPMFGATFGCKNQGNWGFPLNYLLY